MNNRKKALALVLALGVWLAMNTVTTLAYYTATGTATNVITTGTINLKIHEYDHLGQVFPSQGINVKPGDEITKKVTIENTCGHPFYLRVKLVNGIEDSNKSVADVFQMDLNTTDWTVRDDGYIYYNSVLQPGQTTEQLFSRVKMAFGAQSGFAGKVLTLTVTAEGVQSENNPAEQPWLAVGWPGEGGSV